MSRRPEGKPGWIVARRAGPGTEGVPSATAAGPICVRSWRSNGPRPASGGRPARRSTAGADMRPACACRACTLHRSPRFPGREGDGRPARPRFPAGAPALAGDSARQRGRERTGLTNTPARGGDLRRRVPVASGRRRHPAGRAARRRIGTRAALRVRRPRAPANPVRTLQASIAR